MSSSTASSFENIYTLIANVQINFKYLADCYRGNNTLLDNELNNLQNQTETFLAQIEIKHNTEVAFLKEGIIEENEIQLHSQQQTMNKQKDEIQNYQDIINELISKNENFLNQIIQY